MKQDKSRKIDNREITDDHINVVDTIDIPETKDNDSDTFEMSYKNMDFNEMDFEQTYTMYSNLQQKKALNVMDQLQKVQMLNQQYCSGIEQYGQMEDVRGGYGQHERKVLESQPRDEFDQFFSNTESNALEKFLDNLANPDGTANPMHMYTNGQSNYHHDFPVFELHTMRAPAMPTPPQHSISPCEPHTMDHETQYAMKDTTKKTLVDALGNPSLKNMATPGQLPTPLDSRQSSTSYNVVTSDCEQDADQDSLSSALSSPQTGSPGAKKRKRSCHKPLLTVEQKRLNHSLSEQRRRQLCKLAYERCLRLIINFDDYNNVSTNSSKRKSKRRQINKDGLPNLSKHTALTKITNEMITIKRQNDGLRKLLNLE